MNNSIRVMCEPVRVVNHLVLHNAGGAFVSLSAASPALDHPARMILFQNFTNGDLMISDDGVNDKFPIASGSFILYDFTANASGLNGGWYYAEGTRFFARYLEDPTDGDMYMTVFYGAEV